MNPKKSARQTQKLRRTNPAAHHLPQWTLWVGAALVLLAVLFVAVRPIMDPDTWFHLAFGRLLSEGGAFPRTDVFSHTSPGNEWISSGWLSSVLLYRMYGVAESGAGLIWMSFAVVALAYGTAYVSAVRWYKAPAIMATLLVLGAGIAIARFSPRPDLWSQLGISLLLVLLLSAERQAASTQRAPRRLWLMPLILLAWANLHAGFLAGLLTSAIYSAWALWRMARGGERWRLLMLAPVVIAICGVWLVNPYGAGIVRLAAKIGSIPEVGWVLEWMPLLRNGFLPPAASLTLIALFAALAGSVAWVGRKRLDLWHLAVAALFVLLVLMQRRQVGLAVIAIPLVLSPAMPALEVGRRWLVALAAAALLLVSTLHVRGQLISDRSFLRVGINCTALPCDATDYLTQARPPEPIFNSYGLGGFLLFHLGPQTKVFIDGRLDVYDHQVWLDYLAVDEGRLSIAEAEKKYRIKSWVLAIETAVEDPEHLASRLARSPEHALVYFDDNVAVFVQRSALVPPHQEFRYASPWKPKALTATVLKGEVLVQAAAEVERAVQLSNGSASAWALAALVSRAAGDQQGLATALQQATIRNPNNPVLTQARQLMQ